MTKLLSGYQITRNLRGNLSEETLNTTFTLTDTKGKVVLPGSNVLTYGERYLITASADEGLEIQQLTINSVEYQSGDYFTYLPTNTLNIEVVCKAQDLESPVVNITVVDDTHFNWKIRDNHDISGYAITTTNEIPTTWITTGTLDEGTYEISQANTYYVWGKDAAGNTGVSSVRAFTIQSNLTHCELENEASLTLQESYESQLIVDEGYNLSNIQVLMDGVDVTEEVVSFGPKETDPSMFEFDGSTITKYIGTDTEVIIPKTYSIVKGGPVTDAGIDRYYYTYLYQGSGAKDFIITDGTITKTYATRKDVADNYPTDFPNGGRLISTSYDTTSTASLIMFFQNISRALLYPVYWNNTKYNNYNSLYSAWMSASPTTITFSGNVDKYIKGKDYNITELGQQCFFNNYNITSVTIQDNILSIGNWIFRECRGLTSITIASSITSISIAAFSGCTGLTSITIPNSVTSISESAFSNCTGLTSIIISNSVTSIGASAFANCSGLTSITIPSSVTSIGSYAFAGCSNLQLITIPSSVTSIGSYAFNNCTGLTSIIFNDTTTWYRTTNSSYTGGTQTNVTNSSTNATYFKSTYYTYYWYKV